MTMNDARRAPARRSGRRPGTAAAPRRSACRRRRRARIADSAVERAVDVRRVELARHARQPRAERERLGAARSPRTTSWAKRSRSGLCARSEPDTSISTQHAARPRRPLAPRERARTSPPVRLAACEHALQVEPRAAPRTLGAPRRDLRQRVAERRARARRARRAPAERRAPNARALREVERARVQARARRAARARPARPRRRARRRGGLALAPRAGAGLDSSTSSCPPRKNASKTASKRSKSSGAADQRDPRAPVERVDVLRRRGDERDAGSRAFFGAATATPASSSARRKPCRCSRASSRALRHPTPEQLERARRARRPPAP